MGADGTGSTEGVTVPVEGCEASPDTSAWAAALRRATGFGFTLRPGGILSFEWGRIFAPLARAGFFRVDSGAKSQDTEQIQPPNRQSM